MSIGNLNEVKTFSSAVDIIPKEPHMPPMVPMESETVVEAKLMIPEFWNAALEIFFNPSAHASFKMHLLQCIIFFTLERTLFGE